MESTAPAPPRRPDRCDGARTALAAGSPNRALRETGRILAAEPGAVDARRLRAHALLQLGHRSTAVADMLAVAESPDGTVADWFDVLSLGQALADRALVERAVVAIDRQHQLTADVALDAADAAFIDADLGAAQAWIERAVAISPDHPEVERWRTLVGDERRGPRVERDVHLAIVAARLGRDQPAAALAHLDEHVPDADVWRGRALLGLGRMAEATAAFERAHRDRPDDDLLLLELANATLRSGNPVGASRRCDDVVARSAGLADAWTLSSEARLASGDVDGALLAAGTSVALAPDEPEPWLARSGALLAAGDLAGSRIAADHAIALDPLRPAAWRRGADVLDSLGRVELAAWYRSTAAARGGAGTVVDRCDLPAIPIDDTEVTDARARSADSATSWVGLDRFAIAYDLHANELAAAHAAWLAEVEPDADGSLASARGVVLLELGDTVGAVEAFRSAVMIDPTNAQASSGLAAATALSRPPVVPTPQPVADGSSPRRPTSRGGVAVVKRVAVVAWLLLGVAMSVLVMVNLLRGGDTGTTAPAAPALTLAEGGDTTVGPSATEVPPASPAPAATTPATAPPSTTAAPVTLPPATVPPAADEPGTPLDPFETRYFATPDEAIADWLSELTLPYGGTCESLAGQEAELGGAVVCSQLVEDLVPAEIHIWGVFATDDFGGWILVDVGSAGWSVADESFELEPPAW